MPDQRPVVIDPGPVSDLAAWVPSVLDGGRVVLRNVPGAVSLAREGFAAGLVCLVGDPHDPASARAAVDRALADDVPQQVTDAATTVLSRRLELTRSHGDPATGLTAPGVLALALDPDELAHAVAACAQAVSWGGRACVVVRSDLRRGAGFDPAAVVVTVGDPDSRRLDRAGHRALRGAGRRLPPLAPAAAATDRVLTRVQAYLGPARTARRVPAWSGPGPLDLVVGSGELGQTVLWRTLRAEPEATVRGRVTRNTVRDLVRDLTVRVAAGRR